jgi:DNA-binding transcriptional ArsR family regulator
MKEQEAIEQDLQKGVADAFLRGSKSAGQRSAFQYLGLACNPFDIDYILANPQIITQNSKSILSRFAERAGYAVESNTNLLVLGPEASGKTLLCRLLFESLNRSMGENFAVYVEARNEWSGLRRTEEGTEIDGFQSWANEQDFSRTKIVLVDNGDYSLKDFPQYYGHLKRATAHPPVFVFGVSYPSYAVVKKNESYSNLFRALFSLRARDNSEIEDLLHLSIDSCKLNSDPLEADVYRLIAHYSLGLPGLAKELASEALVAASEMGFPHVNKKLLSDIADAKYYVKARTILNGETKLDGTKFDIALAALREFYQFGEIRRSRLLDIFSDLSRSTLAYHFKDLVKEGILIPDKLGFRILYRIPKPVRCALEMVASQEVASV